MHAGQLQAGNLKKPSLDRHVSWRTLKPRLQVGLSRTAFFRTAAKHKYATQKNTMPPTRSHTLHDESPNPSLTLPPALPFCKKKTF
jgi:hypothetical protein